jgi:CRISPR/Cas system Type II protein with McrA/HNH and RuvC-like nuclease domain
MKTILGLDLGTNSVGWMLIQQGFEITKTKILRSTYYIDLKIIKLRFNNKMPLFSTRAKTFEINHLTTE